MGLRDKLEKPGEGSILSKHDGATPSINGLATDASELQNAYSLSGENFSLVNSQFQNYEDGAVNILPPPSILDIDGIKPKGALRVSGYGRMNNSFEKGTYLNNLPE